MVNIEGLNKADVLAALYNHSRPQGMGILHFNAEPMTPEQASDLLKQGHRFDYLNGRVMKISLKHDDHFDEWGYDRDLGEGAAQRVIDELRKQSAAA